MIRKVTKFLAYGDKIFFRAWDFKKTLEVGWPKKIGGRVVKNWGGVDRKIFLGGRVAKRIGL